MLLLLTTGSWFFLVVWQTLEPLFVKDVLRLGEEVFPLLVAANAVGSLLGAMGLALSHRGRGLEVRLIGASLVASGAALLVVASVPVLSVALVGTAVMGVAVAWFLSLSQALIQRVTPGDLRARVTGVVATLQEATGLACTVAIAVFSGLIVVQSTLWVAAALMLVSGLAGLRARPPHARPAPAVSGR